MSPEKKVKLNFCFNLQEKSGEYENKTDKKPGDENREEVVCV